VVTHLDATYVCNLIRQPVQIRPYPTQGGVMNRPIYEFRPLPQFFETRPVRRYADGAWIPDDGEYDLAFIAGGCGEPICLYVVMPYQKHIEWKWLTQHWTGNETNHPGGNPWHYMLSPGKTEWGGDWGRSDHPNARAGDAGMAELCRQFNCANGIHVEWNLRDPHMLAGLVRDRETGTVVVVPERPICMYCEELWRKGA
jgi:hypothetical protein